MLPQTRAPRIAGPPQTYGCFIDEVRRALQIAAGARVDAANPYAHIDGYERLLRVTGAHLRQLDALTSQRPDGLHGLQARLLRLPQRDSGKTPWDDAATQLGVAHDLVATHLGPHNQLRTPEAADVLDREGALPAIRDVTDIALTAATAGRDLVRLAANENAHVPQGSNNRTYLIKLTSSVLIHAKAVLWDFDSELGHAGTAQMAQLLPALVLRPAAPPQLTSPMQALRLLRHAAYSQARGQADASAESLRDLALLGIRVTTEIREQLPQQDTSRRRVEAAHLHDSLDTANTAWQEAAEGVGNQVQAVTKAPATFGTAVIRLLQAQDLSLPVCTAILAALPRMGNDGAMAVRRLTRGHLLATASRGPGRLSPAWRPLHEHEGERLASRFVLAANTTHDAADQVRRHTSRPHTDAPVPEPVHHRTREQHRQVTHP